MHKHIIIVEEQIPNHNPKMTFSRLLNHATLSRGASLASSVLVPPSSNVLFNQQVRSFAVTGRHSKNVAGKKNKLDAMKTKLYNRLGVKIMMAAKAGGSDPTKNVELARALKEAHSVKLPKDNIERALKKATDQSGENFSTGYYEVYGHGGVGLIVATLTDNSNRANMAIKSLAKKSDVKMASSGSVMFNFDHKAVFTPENDYDKDQVVETAIEVDIDDIDFIENHDAHHDDESEKKPLDLIVTNADQLSKLQDVMEKLSINGSSNLVYLPKERVGTSDEDFDKNAALVEGFENLDDVDTVFHNMELK